MDFDRVCEISGNHVCHSIYWRILLFDCINGYAGMPKNLCIKHLRMEMNEAHTLVWTHTNIDYSKNVHVLMVVFVFLCFCVVAGVHQWNSIARYSWLFISYSKDCRPYGHIDIVLIGSVSRLAPIGNACINSTNVTILNCDLHTRDAKLFSVKWPWRWSLQVKY